MRAFFGLTMAIFCFSLDALPYEAVLPLTDTFNEPALQIPITTEQELVAKFFYDQKLLWPKTGNFPIEVSVTAKEGEYQSLFKLTKKGEHQWQLVSTFGVYYARASYQFSSNANLQSLELERDGQKENYEFIYDAKNRLIKIDGTLETLSYEYKADKLSKVVLKNDYDTINYLVDWKTDKSVRITYAYADLAVRGIFEINLSKKGLVQASFQRTGQAKSNFSFATIYLPFYLSGTKLIKYPSNLEIDELNKDSTTKNLVKKGTETNYELSNPSDSQWFKKVEVQYNP